MVTSLDIEPVDPASVGVHPGRLRILLDRVRTDVEDGPLPSAQIAVARRGHLVADETFGDATPSTRYITQSAGRPILAICAWKLMSDGLLDVDEPVAAVIPAFGANGKEQVTFRHVLTHTGGFPMAPIRYPAMRDRAQRLEAMSRWRLSWEPGTRIEYHLTSAAWVIAEAIEARAGLPLPEYLRTVVSAPLGLDLELGVAPERQADTVAPILPMGETPEGWEPDPWGPWFFRDPEVLAAGEPSHTICATARDTVLLYQAVYHTDLLDPAVVAESTSPLVEMQLSGDYGNGAFARQGLFVMLAGPATTSSSTWGHSGAPSSLTWHDPETDLSFAFYTNGYPPSGYDVSRSGRNRSTVVGTLGGDVLDE
jgi:CubicO group peptidase (beta-lactamase class C family)